MHVSFAVERYMYVYTEQEQDHRDSNHDLQHFWATEDRYVAAQQFAPVIYLTYPQTPT